MGGCKEVEGSRGGPGGLRYRGSVVGIAVSEDAPVHPGAISHSRWCAVSKG